jgi:hypothetical protein
VKLQISIVGIFLIVAIYSISIAILVLLWNRLKAPLLRLSVTVPLTVVLFALPVADEAWIAWQFNELCKDAGVRVSRKVLVDGYYDDIGGGPSESGPVLSPQAVAAYEKSGFRFKEIKVGYGRRENIAHIEKNGEGQWRIEILNVPQARYHYKILYEDESAGYQLRRTKYVVADSSTGEIVGSRSLYKRYPGWVDRLWVGLLGSGMVMCPDPESGPRQPVFPDAVFVATNK